MAIEDGRQVDVNHARSGGPASSISFSSSQARSTCPSNQSFSFVTITDPLQIKSTKNKQAVRSHVMLDYVAGKKRRHGDCFVNHDMNLSRRRPSSKVPSTDGTAEGLASVKDIVQSFVPDQVATCRPAVITPSPEQKDVSRYDQALWILRKADTSAAQQAVFLQDDATLEKMWNAGFVKPYCIRSLGDADPFLVLPQSRNPMIHMANLKMWCTRRFGTKAMCEHWVPALTQSRITFLAALCIAAPDMDIASGLRQESALTIAVKNEVIEMINEQLNYPDKHYTDETIMAVHLLLCGEVTNGNELMWSVHEDAITRILSHRGGLQTLGVGGDLAVVVFVAILMMNILRESQPHEVYKRFVKLPSRSISAHLAIPESPVYCPRSGFVTIARSRYCSERLFELLSDMRGLTEQLLAKGNEGSWRLDEDSMLIAGSESSDSRDVDQIALAKVRDMRQFDPINDAPSYSAWTLEACRIASLIYATALAARIPFSEAARLIDAQEEGKVPQRTGMLPHCLRELRDAVMNSNVGDSWTDMIGVLFWVTLVGGAAAHKPPLADRWTDDDGWTQKFMTSTSMRLSVLLCFEHGKAAMSTVRRLNEVQRKLTSSCSEVSRMHALAT